MKKILTLSLIVVFTYADIDDLGFNSDNTMDKVVVKDASTVKQGDLKIVGSTLKSNTFTLAGSLKDAIVENSSLTQSIVCITSATVENVTIDSSSRIDNNAGTMNIVNSTISQSSIYIPTGSTLKDSTIKLDSSIENTKIENSNVSLCNLYIANGATVSGVDTDATCELRDSEIIGANVSQGNISYSN